MSAERIAFVCPRFAEGPTVGGAETLMRNLARETVKAGRDVTFLTTCARNHFTWENDLPEGSKTFDGLDVHFFPVDQDRDIGGFLRIQDKISRGRTVSEEEELFWLNHNVNSRALCSYLEAQAKHYDRILAGPYLFGLIYHAARVCPRKTLLVPCLHDEVFAYLAAFKRMFTEARGCLFNSAPERDLAIRLYGLDRQELAVVGMGLDPFQADPAACAKRIGIHAPYLVYSGRREPLKGTPLLIDYVHAFRERTGIDLKLVMTGSGRFDMPAELAPHVFDLGFVSEQEKHDAMAGAVAFCHPSTNESFGIVVLEAWLAGTPVLVHGCGDVLPDHCRKSGGGLWFRTYPEFEEALKLVLDNDALRGQMGRAGRKYVEHQYSWEAVGQRLLTALDA